MSHQSKKINRRTRQNLLLDACHNLLTEAKKVGVSMNKLRKMFPASFFTAKRYRHGTLGAFGPSGFPESRDSRPLRIKGAVSFPGNSHDRRKRRRACPSLQTAQEAA